MEPNFIFPHLFFFLFIIYISSVVHILFACLFVNKKMQDEYLVGGQWFHSMFGRICKVFLGLFVLYTHTLYFMHFLYFFIWHTTNVFQCVGGETFFVQLHDKKALILSFFFNFCHLMLTKHILTKQYFSAPSFSVPKPNKQSHRFTKPGYMFNRPDVKW